MTKQSARTSDLPDLWQQVASRDALQEAWYRVLANDGGSGGDGVGLGQFKSDLFANLTQLRAELLGGTYRTGPFRKVSIPKKKPGYRILTIPSIRDRVLHTSIANALTPIFEILFEDSSFAYRPGRGVVQAVARIESWRQRGYSVVIEADIVSYFDNIDHAILLQKMVPVLTPRPGSAALLELIGQIVADQGKALGTLGQGLVQGSPLSPLLANLYLDSLDEEIDEQGVKLVRFADDFVILCKTQKRAEKVLAHCVKILAAHNLRLHEDGTRIVSFDKGFDFIGYLFVRSLALKEKKTPQQQAAKPVKSHVTDEGVIELEDGGSRFDPGKRVLYVLDAAHTVATRNRSFSVLREDGSELIAIPHQRIGRIEVGPATEFSRRPIDLAVDCDIEFALIDRFGQTRGNVNGGGGKHAGLQFAQAKAVSDDVFRRVIAWRLVEARIHNQRTQLSRLARGHDGDHLGTALDQMKRILRKLPGATSVDSLRGLEGAATATYWPILGSLLNGAGDTPFRRSRPAEDPLNAVINYMTAILERDMRAAIQSVGLHPGFAFLHGVRDRHDGLVFDLMEPFRAPLTEGLAVYLLNARRLRADMFLASERWPVEISDEGRRAIVLGYETAVARRVNRTDGGGKLGWRAMMQHQARLLVHAVTSTKPDPFVPYLLEA